MKKIIYGILGTLFLFSCDCDEKIDEPLYYPQLIGEWINVHGSTADLLILSDSASQAIHTFVKERTLLNDYSSGSFFVQDDIVTFSMYSRVYGVQRVYDWRIKSIVGNKLTVTDELNIQQEYIRILKTVNLVSDSSSVYDLDTYVMEAVDSWSVLDTGVIRIDNNNCVQCISAGETYAIAEKSGESFAFRIKVNSEGYDALDLWVKTLYMPKDVLEKTLGKATMKLNSSWVYDTESEYYNDAQIGFDDETGTVNMIIIRFNENVDSEKLMNHLKSAYRFVKEEVGVSAVFLNEDGTLFVKYMIDQNRLVFAAE